MNEVLKASGGASPPAVTIGELVKLGAQDGQFFARSFFPKTFRQTSPPAHRVMWRHLDNPNVRYFLEEAFRGSAKTTLCRVFAARRIAYNVSRTILYIGASEDHAIRSIQWIRAQVERNKLFSSTFGLRPGKKWTDTELQIHHGVDEEPIWVMGVGITGNIRGINFDDYRPDLIICDDVLTDENTATREQREKTTTLLLGAVKESLTPATEEPNAKLVVLQTPLNPEDAVAEIKKDPQWAKESFPCWTPDTVDAPADMQVSSWEERFPTETLRGEKAAAATRNRLSIFTREMECRLVSAETAAFRPNWLKRWSARPPLQYSVLAIDPVPPPSEKAVAKALIGLDYEAQMVVGRRGGLYSVLEYTTNKGHNPNWTVAKAIELASKYRVTKIIIDATAYQRVLKFLLETEFARRRQYWPVVPITDGRAKYAKITSEISGVASAGMLQCDPEATDLISQFTAYPAVPHDDLLDALQLALHELVSPYLELGGDDYEEVTGGDAFSFGRGAP